MSGGNSNPATWTVSSSTQLNVQMVLLAWLDSNIDQNKIDCQNTITHFRRITNAVSIFTDGDECIRFLQDMDNEKACVIISGALGQNMMPRMHDLSQIDSIFIFCSNKTYHETWIKDWPKIKGVFTEIKLLCDALKQAAKQCEQNGVSLSIMGVSEALSNESFDQLDLSFMYIQSIKEILLTIDFEQRHIDEFIQHCRQALNGNPSQLEYVEQLAKTYHKKTPIWWYTLECFLQPMLNRALRTMDADMIVKLGFFIVDLHRQIQELHQKQFGSDGSKQKFTVYRGNGMEKRVFDKMVASKAGLISFNCFLSTSKTREVCLQFAKCALSNLQMVGVLFVMTIDPALCEIPFASVAKIGASEALRDEVLFSMNTVFRINQIKSLDDNPRLFRVELSMISAKDNNLHHLIDRIREETSPDAVGWHRLALLLWKMGESAKAKELFETLLKQTTEESTRGVIYGNLGMVADHHDQCEEATAYYEKSIKIEEKQNPCNRQSLATSYSNIGSVYNRMGDYSKALSSYEKALAIRQQSLPATHPDLASSHNNIGSVYNRMGDYSKALSSYEKALAIRQQSLPPTHPDLASSHNNIGSVYGSMGDYSKALSSYEKALAIRQQLLPPTHPDLASSYNNMGLVQEKMNNFSKAHSYYERAVDIAQRSLPSDHTNLQEYQNNLARIKKTL